MSSPPQNESTPFHHRSPYGCAKAYAYHVTVNYREAYGMFAASGILFNHESPRRGENFVAHSVRDCCELAFTEAGLDWQSYVRHDPAFDRPSDVDYLVADPSKAQQKLGWKPQMSFGELVAEMVRSDRERLRRQQLRRRQ